MDRELLDNLLKSKFGEDFDTSSITDEDIKGLLPDNNSGDSNEEEDDMIDDTDDTSREGEVVDDNDEEIDLENINYEELSEDAKLMYNMMIKERQARLNDKIDNIIASSELSDAQKKVVKRFAKTSSNIADIKEMIADLEKDNKASKRFVGTTRIIGKNNVKSTIKIEKQKKTPAYGTKEFGAWLAKR